MLTAVGKKAVEAPPAAGLWEPQPAGSGKLAAVGLRKHSGDLPGLLLTDLRKLAAAGLQEQHSGGLQELNSVFLRHCLPPGPQWMSLVRSS